MAKKKRMKTVAIVGRPNVGKSRLFNRMIGRRYSIVEGQPGVTRDRVEQIGEVRGEPVRWIDTGGIGADDEMGEMVKIQAEIAISAADLILLVTDVRAGLQALDEQIAHQLRGTKPVIIVANKADEAASEADWTEFTRLGFDVVVPISAEHGRRIGDLLDEVEARLGKVEDLEEENPVEMRLAIVGRPNVGKSSFLNKILGTERVIVSDVPGTTRDAIEEIIELPPLDSDPEGETRRIQLVDTAGIRKRRGKYTFLESVMVARTRDAVGRSDVALVLCDSNEGVTDQDMKILAAVLEMGKGAVLVYNKWDLAEDRDFDTLEKEIRGTLGTSSHVPIVSSSALTGQRLRRVIEVALQVSKNCHFRIKTGELNRLLAEISVRAPRGVSIKYGVQKSILPPGFILFGKGKATSSFEGYIRNKIRDHGEFDGVPLTIEFRT